MNRQLMLGVLVAMCVACTDMSTDSSHATKDASGAPTGASGASATAPRLIAPADVGLDAEGVVQTTHVNCVNNGQTVAMNAATPRALMMACASAMRFQNGLYACTGDNNNARCDIGFGVGDTPLVAGACQNLSGNEPLRNPPGGSINRDSGCQGFSGGLSSVYSRGFTPPGGVGSPPPTLFIAMGGSCTGCADQNAILRAADHHLWYNY